MPRGLFCLSEIPPFCVECLLAVVSPENLTPAGAAVTMPWNAFPGARQGHDVERHEIWETWDSMTHPVRLVLSLWQQILITFLPGFLVYDMTKVGMLLTRDDPLLKHQKIREE